MTPTLFLRLFSFHFLLAVITLFLQTLAFTFLKIDLWTLRVDPIHINIDFTKLGASAFIILFLRLRCGAHLIQQPTADSVVEPLIEDLIALMSQHTEML